MVIPQYTHMHFKLKIWNMYQCQNLSILRVLQIETIDQYCFCESIIDYKSIFRNFIHYLWERIFYVRFISSYPLETNWYGLYIMINDKEIDNISMASHEILKRSED